ncbi:helix-turn-helix transcriptional regulator [Tenacibaculum maritimum]|nr:helix-turn-helix transcriptional regulator [Tenacibaculum maritimum]MDB0601608.1 helix-turn-helix transcriptional regulator [Tenacibaculum maritimum]MDB0601623.1 helix-turn-helix transcriptional regulator [Tenacibaculum maritimum]MDB0601668.1 helix-turn-helix transcriptional regulator [Tenacibaculum maritimum]MDB0612855.1 helix-turn-helix transcriptional regulator [Tenacibaculum maritimum]
MNSINKIKELRKKLNLTQDDFAKKIGVSRGVIAQIEIGNNNPSKAVLTSVKDSFGVDIKYIEPSRNNTKVISNEDFDELYLISSISQIGIVSLSIDYFAEDKNLNPKKRKFNSIAKRLNYYEKAHNYELGSLDEDEISELCSIVKLCLNAINDDLAALVSFNYNAIKEYYNEDFEIEQGKVNVKKR